MDDRAPDPGEPSEGPSDPLGEEQGPSGRSSLRELHAALRDGKPGAWEDCLERFGSLVLGIARSSGLDQESAEDVFQETWVSLHGQVGLLRHPAALPGWISTTAKRLAWRAATRDRRRSEREDRVARDREVQRSVRKEEDMLEASALLEDQTAVWEALDRLPDRCRELLTLLHLSQESPSYQEASEELDMPLGSVGPTRQRCLEKLARLLETRFD